MSSRSRQAANSVIVWRQWPHGRASPTARTAIDVSQRERPGEHEPLAVDGRREVGARELDVAAQDQVAGLRLEADGPDDEPRDGRRGEPSATGRARSMSSRGPVSSNASTRRATASARDDEPSARLSSRRSVNAARWSLRSRAMRVATAGSACERTATHEGLAPPPPTHPMELDARAAIHHDLEAALDGDPTGLSARDAKLEPQAARAGRDRLTGMAGALVGASKDIDDVERTGGRHGRRQVRVAGEAVDRGLVRIHRHDLVAERAEVAQHAVGRPGGVVRGADHRDPARRAKHVAHAGIVEQGDPEAPVMEVQQVGQAGPIVPRIAQFDSLPKGGRRRGRLRCEQHRRDSTR